MNRQKRKVLIIEDEKDISRIIKEYINKHGYEAASADNGRDGLKIMELLSPDFIILDIMLPDIDGIELCRKIRERNNIPILILSARGSDTDKVLSVVMVTHDINAACRADRLIFIRDGKIGGILEFEKFDCKSTQDRESIIFAYVSGKE
jgi:CheY-like chemotaxis protein